MKLNLLYWRKRLLGGEIFSRTQSTLTLQYSVLLSVFLLLFIVIVYTLLYVLIWNNQEEKLDKLLDAEIKALQGPLYTDIRNGNFDKPGQRPFELSTDQAFYYVIDQEGNLLTGAEIQMELKDQVLALIRGGALRSQSLEQLQLQTREEPALHPQQDDAVQHSVTYLSGHRLLYRDGQLAGALYAGKDVAFPKQLFAWLRTTLLGIALLFLAVVMVCSRWMSRQAMIPIRQAYERQQQFVTDASHELRTPLSILLASIETLDMEHRSEDRSFEGWVIEGLKEEIHRMNRLAGDLLLLARSDTGETVLHTAWLDLTDTAAQTVVRLRLLAEAKQVELKLNSPPELIMYHDREKLVQLIVIFLENAIKYTLPGGQVTLTLADREGAGEDTLLIEVCDTGIGISEEELPLIFERFYRPDKSRSRQMGGHGLGLAIAKQIVEACNGTIHVKSKLGEGSSFRVELPVRYRKDHARTPNRG